MMKFLLPHKVASVFFFNNIKLFQNLSAKFFETLDWLLSLTFDAPQKALI
jgi:hypothetical protein